jgi:hypothetical protein
VPQKRGLVGIYKNKTNLNIPRGFYTSCFSPGWAGTAGARAYIIYLSVTRAGRQLAGSDRGKMLYTYDDDAGAMVLCMYLPHEGKCTQI